MKLEKLKKTGCELIFVDGTVSNFHFSKDKYGISETLKSDQVEVELAAKNAAEANKCKVKFLSPYNDLNIIRGQGSIGIEIFQQCPKVDAVFVTVGGGGLISGAQSTLFFDEEAFFRDSRGAKTPETKDKNLRLSSEKFTSDERINSSRKNHRNGIEAYSF